MNRCTFGFLLLFAACGASAKNGSTTAPSSVPASAPSSAKVDPQRVESVPAAGQVSQPGSAKAEHAKSEPEQTPPPASDKPAEPQAPPLDQEKTRALLGWKSTTAIVRFTSTAHVFAGPGEQFAPLGKIVRTTKSQLLELRDVRTPDEIAAHEAAAAKKGKKPKAKKGGKCSIWAKIAPPGWVCANLLAATNDAAPVALAQPILSGSQVVPGTYYMVRDKTEVFATEESIKANTPKPELLEKTMLRSNGTVDVDGVTFHRTNKGLVAADRLVGLSPSDFAGIDLRDSKHANLTWPFAMVTVGKRGPVVIRNAPSNSGKKVGSKPWRSIVAVGKEQDGFVEIAPDQWIARSSLRVFAKQAKPKDVADGAQWIDVDLDEQTVVAYEGDKPVLATVASTGRKDGTTPVGMYRLRSKAATMRMAGEPGTNESYDVGDIPWSMRFKKGVFFHASYWHDGFGSKRSHGCVNLAPRDAKALYTWAAPNVPDGWSEIEVAADQGTVVRVRNQANPNPAWYNYQDEPKEKPTEDSSEPDAE